MLRRAAEAERQLKGMSMDKPLHGQTVLVTGATGGIGTAIVERLALEGADRSFTTTRTRWRHKPYWPVSVVRDSSYKPTFPPKEAPSPFGGKPWLSLVASMALSIVPGFSRIFSSIVRPTIGNLVASHGKLATVEDIPIGDIAEPAEIAELVAFGKRGPASLSARSDRRGAASVHTCACVGSINYVMRYVIS